MACRLIAEEDSVCAWSCARACLALGILLLLLFFSSYIASFHFILLIAITIPISTVV
jgi:hypothetical protein